MSQPVRLLVIAAITLAGGLIGSSALAGNAFSEATRYYQAGQWEQAAAAFDHAAQDTATGDDQRIDAQLFAGESLIRLDRLAEARQRYQLVYEQHAPTRAKAQALFRLGEIAWLAGELSEATDLLQLYVRRYPTESSVSFARDYLEQAQRRQSLQLNYAELDKAVGWHRDGRHDAALAAYRKLLNNPSADGQLRAEAMRRAALLHDRLSQSREAAELFQRYLAENPHSKHTSKVLLALGWLYDQQLDQSAQAADQFLAVYAKFPQSAQAVEAAYWLAVDRAEDNDIEAASRYVDAALANPQPASARLRTKALCLKCRLLSEAADWPAIKQLIETSHETLEHSPQTTKLEYWSAEASFRLKEYDEAKDKFRELQPRTISINEPWTAMVPLRRAQLAARRQQWSEVLNLLDELEQKHPEFPLQHEIDYLRGRALAGRGNMTAARKYYRRVLDSPAAEGTESFTMAGWMIGETYFHQRDFTRARSAYQRVIEQTTFPEWQARAALQAGKCWELEDRWDEATKIYETALKRWPESKSDQQLTARLRWAQTQAKGQPVTR